MTTRPAEVHDVRYERYDGPRRGRAAGVLSLARWGMLRSLGARRGWRAKAIPLTLIVLAAAPATIVLGLRGLFAEQATFDIEELLPFSGYQALVGIVILVFAAITTPELLCPDRRDGTLSLYLSTAVSRREYLAGRALAAVGPLLLVTLVPLLVLFLGSMLFAESPLDYLRDNAAALPRIVAAGVLLAVYYAAVGLAASSLTGRKAFAIGGYLGVLIAPTLVAGLLVEGMGGGDALRLIALSVLPIELAGRLFDDFDSPFDVPFAAWLGAYALVLAAAAAVLLWRYRRTDL